jgi:DNA-binding winged helix-turn-helix (wHTH) protein/Tol biopolymer transport system component
MYAHIFFNRHRNGLQFAQVLTRPMTFRFPPFVVDPARRLLLRDNTPVPLTPKAFDTLVFLLTHRERVISKDELLRYLWPDTAVEEATLSQHIYLLRRALNDSEEGARYIATIPRRGYRFVADLSDSDVLSSRPSDAPAFKSRTALAPLWFAAAALFVVATIIVSTLARHDRSDASSLRFTIVAPAGTTFSDLALSPDGQRIVFRAIASNGAARLWIRRLDSLTAEPLRGTEEGVSPFWSPNGRNIGFFAGGKLKRIRIDNGAPDVICDAPNPRGGSWNADGTIIFAPDSRNGLYRVASEGGAPTQVTTLVVSDRVTSHRWPEFLADGRHFLFAQMAGERGHAGIFAGSLDGMPLVRVLPDVSNVVYVRSGYVLFVRGDALVAQPFDAGRLHVSGEPITIAEGVGRLASMYARFSLADNGRLIYEAHDPRSQLVWLDRSGHELGHIGEAARQGDPVLAKNGSRVLSWRGEVGGVNIWLDDLTRGASSRLTFTGEDVVPIWSPTEDQAIFRSNRNGPGDLYVKDLTRTDPERLVLKSPFLKEPTDWSPDGRYILYDNYDNTNTSRSQPDIWVLPLDGARRPSPYQASPFTRWAGRFSPDGRWIAFVADETGRPEVYVQAFPADNIRWRVSTGGGDQPQWRRDGKELFFVGSDGAFFAVGVSRQGSSLRLTEPRLLFRTKTKTSRLRNTYAVGPDGDRFLVDLPIEDPAVVPLTVVTNWSSGPRQ